MRLQVHDNVHEVTSCFRKNALERLLSKLTLLNNHRNKFILQYFCEKYTKYGIYTYKRVDDKVLYATFGLKDALPRTLADNMHMTTQRWAPSFTVTMHSVL
jgi:hypothetical protein